MSNKCCEDKTVVSMSRFRKLLSRVSALATAFGDELQQRGFKTGGAAGTVPFKISSTDFAWSWHTLVPSNVVGLITLLNGKAALVHTHPQSQVTNLVTDLTTLTDNVALRALITNTVLVVPTYADNAAAVSGGLAVNRVYKTAAGELRIVV